jgi:hypothetical protein
MYLLQIGFRATGSDASLFIFNHGGATAFLLVYVDDIILTASSNDLLHHIVEQLCSEFAIKDLEALRFFLGVQVTRDATGFFLTQAQYAEEILERAGMSSCKPATTPADTKPKVSLHDGNLLPASDASFYRSIAGALQYLTLTRPDVAYAVNQACLYMHAPRDTHWTLVKRILRYLQGTLDHGISITASSPSQLTAYSDADWAGCPTLAVPHPDTACSLVILWCLGHRSDRRRCRGPARKPSIAVWLTRRPNAAGCATCSANCLWTCPRPRSSTVITSLRSTSQRTRCIISAQNMSNLTSTLCGKRSPLGNFVFCRCLVLDSMQIS